MDFLKIEKKRIKSQHFKKDSKISESLQLSRQIIIIGHRDM